MGTAIGFLAQSSNMSIVGQRHSQSEPVLQHSCQGHDTLPRHIGCILDTARKEIAAGGTDTYGAYLLIATIFLDEHDDTLAQLCDKVGNIRIVGGTEVILCNNLTPDIHQGVCGLRLTDINTDNTGFNFVNCFHGC